LRKAPYGEAGALGRNDSIFPKEEEPCPVKCWLC
jgi:hypothetical protein